MLMYSETDTKFSDRTVTSSSIQSTPISEKGQRISLGSTKRRVTHKMTLGDS